MEIICIRHGETKGNIQKRYVGRTDEELTEVAINLLSEKQYPKVDYVYTSTMKRCIQTANIIYGNTGCTRNNHLREIDFGMFEYKNFKELEGNMQYQEFIASDGIKSFPNGEGKEEFQNRCIRGFYECMEDAVGHQYKAVAFVIHGGTIMSIFDRYSYPNKDYFQWQVANGNGYRGSWNPIKQHIEMIHSL